MSPEKPINEDRVQHVPPESAPMVARTERNRPTKRHERLVRELLTLIASGAPIKDAARHVGIDPVTLWRWRKADPALDADVRAARSAFLQRQIERIDKAAANDWKAAAWLLSRSDPAAWGGKTEVQVEAQSVAVIDPLTGKVLGGPYDGMDEGEVTGLGVGE